MSDQTCTVHPPGTEPCYRRHGCRCTPCIAESRRRKKLSRNGLAPMTDAAPARRRIEALRRKGWSDHAIGMAAGVSGSLIGYIAATARRVRIGTHRKILAAGVPDAGCLDGTGTRRRLQALQAIGWSFSDLSARLGFTRGTVHHWAHSDRVTAATAAATRRLYDELWDQAPPPGMAATRNRNQARAKGWVPPLCWDDDTIDHPDAIPSGVPDAPPARRRWLSADDLAEAIGLGADLASLQGRFGATPAAIERCLHRAGKAALWRSIAPTVGQRSRRAA